MTPLETLRAARQLITDPAKWTQGWDARNNSRHKLDALDEKATCWCAVGALRKVSGDDWNLFQNAVYCLASRSTTTSVDFNDTHTHAEVLALFDAAIAELEGVQS